MTNPDCRENYRVIVSGKTNKGPSLALLRTYTDKDTQTQIQIFASLHGNKRQRGMTNPDCRENYKLIVSGKTNKGPSLALLRTYTDKRHSFPRIRLSQTILVKMRLL